jgi:hypothetical protein
MLNRATIIVFAEFVVNIVVRFAQTGPIDVLLTSIAARARNSNV